MITPLVSEDSWLAVLENSQDWVPPDKPTLIISPHPDDETLGAGGLIAAQASRGLRVSVVAVTDGEAAYANSNGLAETRRREQDQAVRQLGAASAVIRLGIPDSGVSRHEAKLEELLNPLMDPGVLVVAPWINDWHPDHEACARVARKLCEDKGAELIYFVFWTWHRRTADIFQGSKLLRFKLSPDLQAARNAALDCHVSQLRRESGEPILPKLLLAPAFRPFETFVSHV